LFRPPVFDQNLKHKRFYRVQHVFEQVDKITMCDEVCLTRLVHDRKESVQMLPMQIYSTILIAVVVAF